MFKTKIRIKSFVCILLIFVMMSSSIFAGSMLYRTNNPHISQGRYDQLCWAAASVSMIYSLTGEGVGFLEHVRNVYGSVINKGRIAYDIMDDFAEYGLNSRHMGTISFSSLESQMKNNSPVFGVVEWNTGKHHATVISGTDRSGNYLRIMDPGESSWVYMEYNEYKNDYDGRGEWIESLTFY